MPPFKKKQKLIEHSSYHFVTKCGIHSDIGSIGKQKKTSIVTNLTMTFKG